MIPTNNIGFLLQHLSFVLARQSDQALQERLGIGFSQFKIMMVLKWKPNVQQKLIADKLGQTEASISRQIKLLIGLGLLRSMRNPANKREHITVLTAKGEGLTDEAQRVLKAYHAPILASLSPKETALLLSILQNMHHIACERYGSDAVHE